MASPLPKLHPSLWYGALHIIISLFIITPISSSETKSDHNTYIIHMDLKAMPKPFSDHHHWFAATLSSLPSQPSTPPTQHIYTYTNSIHGFTAKLTSSQLEALKSLPGYVSSTKDRKLQLHTTHSPAFLGLVDDSASTKLPPAASSNNKHGEGIIIGIIDTGIWPESESFRDEGMTDIPARWKGKCVSGTQFNSSLCNKKLIGAYFYNKGLLAEHPEVKIPMLNSPRDTDGHGTHTSSTAAGSHVPGASYFGYAPGTARGVAPGARIAVYKAVWRYGVYASDVIAAVDQAIQDGVDVLSLSLGYTEEDAFFEDDVVAAATFAAVERGIFVAASAGNSGSLYNTVINGAPWLTTVGAGTLDRGFGGTLRLSGNGDSVPLKSLYPGEFSTKERPIVFLDGCASVEEMKKNKKNIIVCKDNLSISDQVENAQAAKVSGIVFITDTDVSEFYTRSSIPAGFVGSKYGKIVTDYIKSTSNSRGVLEFRKTIIGTSPEPRVDGYSGRGPFPSCPSVFKPDVIAPGTMILAAWSPVSSVAQVGKKDVFSSFNIVSGTSMATPHVAGAAALIKNSHPDWSPAAIRSALMTTASFLDNVGEPIKDASEHNSPADPLATGSGHIDPIKALDPGLVYDATTDDYITLLCAMNFTAKQIQAITRSSGHKCVGNKYTKVVADLNYPAFLAYFNAQDNGSKPRVVVREFRRSVTNVGGDGAASYTAKLTEVKGVVVKVEPEKLVFKRKNEKLGYKLTVEGPEFFDDAVVHGSLSWVHDGGKYVVRSPIVATSILPESPFT